MISQLKGRAIMAEIPLQKRWKFLPYTIRRYNPYLWRFPETRKVLVQVVWRRPLSFVKWLFFIVGIIVIPILLVRVILLGYSLPFTDFTGFNEKKLWDWLQLLIIPIVLAVGGTIFNLRGANFSDLRIHETKLSSKYLQMTGTRIPLRNANLQGAIFRDASLEQVDLRDACLDNAYFSSVDLSGTCLCKASMKNTRL